MAVQVFKAQVVGVRRGKGDFEGTAYDYCKVCVLLPQDETGGNAVGFGSAEYALGKSDQFARFRDWKFPVLCEIDVVTVVSNGEARQVCSDVRPVK